MARTSDDSGGLNVLTKVGAVITAVAATNGITAAALAKELDEPISSVYRLLANLAALRWVERGEKRGQYRLGTRFTWLGDRVERQLDLRSTSLPSLRALNSETRQTTFLCIRTDNRATCIERIEGEDVQIQRLKLGGSLPLHEGASTRVLLAYAPADFIDEYVETIRDDRARAQLSEQLTAIRSQGYAVADDEFAAGIRSVGAPVFNHRNEVIAAISISGLLDRGVVDDQASIERVRQEAERISAAMGLVRSNLESEVAA